MQQLDLEHNILKLLEEPLLNAIAYINKSFKKRVDTITSKFKVVIVGGFAMQQYANFELFNTHDIDARLVAIDSEVIQKLANKDQYTTLQFYRAKLIAINAIIDILNQYITQTPNIIDQIKETTNCDLVKTKLDNGDEKYFFQRYLEFAKIENSDDKICNPDNFDFVKEINVTKMPLDLLTIDNFCASKLSSCFYTYNYEGNSIKTGIFDIVPLTPYDRPSFTLFNDEILQLSPSDTKLIGKWWMRTDENNAVFVNTAETFGLIPYYLDDSNIVEIDDNIFVAGIGYIIWDNVYMINYCLSVLSQLKSEEEYINDLVKLKFNRYVQKYILFLRALDTPSVYLNCPPLKEFVQSCSTNDKEI